MAPEVDGPLKAGCDAPTNRGLLQDAGYVFEPIGDTWWHEGLERSIAAGVVDVLTSDQIRTWIEQRKK